MRSPHTTPTALLLIDLQLGLLHPTFAGPSRSTPDLESNITSLLDATRKYNASIKFTNSATFLLNKKNKKNGDDVEADSSSGSSNNGVVVVDDHRHYHPISIIHIHHHSQSTDSLLHPSHVITWSDDRPEFNGYRGIDPLPCAEPFHPLVVDGSSTSNTTTTTTTTTAVGDDSDSNSNSNSNDNSPSDFIEKEIFMTKSVNSAFIGTNLEGVLRKRGTRQVIITGMTMEHCVSTSVRMAANLNVVEDVDGMGERGVVLVEDGCAAFAKVDRQGKVVCEADLVQRVEVECLRDEFAEVVRTKDVVELLKENKCFTV